MTQPQRRTLAFLVTWFTTGVLSLFGWELYAVASPDSAALITTVVKIIWANEPWIILAIAAASAYLSGHFFAGPRAELDAYRAAMRAEGLQTFEEFQASTQPTGAKVMSIGSVWNFLKGKKTYIGAFLVLVGKATGVPLIEQAGTVIAGLGLADKAKDEALGGRD